jgi:hypothetical protein
MNTCISGRVFKELFVNTINGGLGAVLSHAYTVLYARSTSGSPPPPPPTPLLPPVSLERSGEDILVQYNDTVLPRMHDNRSLFLSFQLCGKLRVHGLR